jgi:hypothetical protein
MAEIAPGADYRPLPRTLSTTPLQRRFINLHTMVGSLRGSEAWFSGSGRPYSHFGVGKRGLDGELWQWQDLRYRAASDLEGNPYSISFETEDDGPNEPIPPWTEAQIKALVQTIAWLCRRYSIPAVLLNDSLPIPDGVSYHRLGINPWRVPGGLLYSSSPGKLCPADVRIAQIRTRIMPGVLAILNPPVEDDMFSETDRDLLEKINGMLDQRYYTRPEVYSAMDDVARRVGVGTDATMDGVDNKLDEVLARLTALEARLPPAEA